MTETFDNLVLDLVEWVARKERTYDETIEAWRTSCPKFPVWEEAVDHGLVAVSADRGEVVHATPAGIALLRERRRLAARSAFDL